MTPTIPYTVEQLTRGITPPSEAWRSKARARLDTLTKPLGSLGRLEDLAAQVAAIREDKLTIPSGPIGKSVYVFAADHGITAEGVSAYPREVTHRIGSQLPCSGGCGKRARAPSWSPASRRRRRS